MLLNRVWNRWKKIGQFIGDWIARVVLTVFYISIFLPFGVALRLLGDPLAMRPEHKPRWLKRRRQEQNLDLARRLS